MARTKASIFEKALLELRNWHPMAFFRAEDDEFEDILKVARALEEHMPPMALPNVDEFNEDIGWFIQRVHRKRDLAATGKTDEKRQEPHLEKLRALELVRSEIERFCVVVPGIDGSGPIDHGALYRPALPVLDRLKKRLVIDWADAAAREEDKYNRHREELYRDAARFVCSAYEVTLNQVAWRPDDATEPRLELIRELCGPVLRRFGADNLSVSRIGAILRKSAD